MNKFLLGEESLDDKGETRLKYFLLEESKYVEETSKNVKCYGIEAQKITKDNIEKNLVHDITTEKESAVSMVNILKNNKIMPIHLQDVIMDML